MRFVDRSAEKCPSSLDGAESKGQKEIKRVQKHLSKLAQAPAPVAAPAPVTPKQQAKKSKKPKKAGKPSFSAYKSDDVVAALERLFHKKCAYCESSYKAVITIQVEHFRPKSRVAGETAHPGYWWLAANWDNLLPSCVHCNGTEYLAVQHLSAEPAYTQPEKGGLFKLGKYDFFPIAGTRAFEDGDSLDAEDPQLIDPTKVDPQKHLTWVIEGGLSLVAPIAMSNGVWDPKGFETYRRFGLNRQGLVELRTDLLREVMTTVLRAEEWLKQAAVTEAGPQRTFLIDQALGLLDGLKPLTGARKPYSMMVKSALDSERNRIEEQFGSLLQ
ncbi:hypothetical protein [Roseateles noduli]|uniref:hypothetical protein n=1 Tax=Roseateles noduli TaxID=2052484 RepID=UPI003D648126